MYKGFPTEPFKQFGFDIGRIVLIEMLEIGNCVFTAHWFFKNDNKFGYFHRVLKLKFSVLYIDTSITTKSSSYLSPLHKHVGMEVSVSAYFILTLNLISIMPWYIVLVYSFVPSLQRRISITCLSSLYLKLFSNQLSNESLCLIKKYLRICFNWSVLNLLIIN